MVESDLANYATKSTPFIDVDYQGGYDERDSVKELVYSDPSICVAI